MTQKLTFDNVQHFKANPKLPFGTDLENALARYANRSKGLSKQ